MDHRKFLENKDELLLTAKKLLQAKPFFHAVSGTTTALYVMMYASSVAIIQSFTEATSYFGYLTIAVSAFGLAFIIERLLSSLLDGFGMAVATNVSKRLTIALGALVLPLFVASSFFSFSSVREGTVHLGDKEGYLSLAALTEDLNKNDNSGSSDLIIDFSKDRRERRQSLKDKYAGKEKAALANNAKLYPEASSNEWQKKKLEGKNADDVAYLANKLIEKLEDFDDETDRLKGDKEEEHLEASEGHGEFKTRALEFQKEENDKIIGKHDNKGWLFGIIVVIGLVCSMICSIAARWICAQLGVKPKSLFPKKKKRVGK